jgi:hypothetical protein
LGTLPNRPNRHHLADGIEKTLPTRQRHARRCPYIFRVHPRIFQWAEIALLRRLFCSQFQRQPFVKLDVQFQPFI